MKIDLYTKVVLTVIAVCLVLQAFKIFEPAPAKARNEIIRVDLAQIDGKDIFLSPYLRSDQRLERLLEKVIAKAVAQKVQSVYVEGGYMAVSSSHKYPVYVKVVN